MSLERPFGNPEIPEVPKQKYAEEIFERLPETETGVDIPRASITRLTTGKDARLELSITERLTRDGWNPEDLAGVRTGDMVVHRTGDVFEVLEVKKGRMRIGNPETNLEGEIIAQPINIKAQEYSYNLRDSFKNSRKVKVYDTVYRDRSLDTSEFIDNIVGAVPEQCMDVFDEIEIHRMGIEKTGSFRAEPSLFSSRKVLTLYVYEEGYPTKVAVETLYHELGHAIAKEVRGIINPGEAWKRRMVADGNSISEYASKTRCPKQNDNGEIEDFAESVRLYLATDGAKKDTMRSLRDFCKNRFEKLDEVFEYLSTKQRAGRLTGLKRRILKQPTPLNK